MHRILYLEIFHKRHIHFIRTAYSLIIIIFAIVGTLVAITLYQLNFTGTISETRTAFPIGVNQESKTIVEQASVEDFITSEGREAAPTSIWTRNPLARSVIEITESGVLLVTNPNSKVVVIYAGERKEEATQNIGAVLGWSKADRATFMKLVRDAIPEVADGQFYPGKYLVPRSAKPVIVAQMVIDRFESEIRTRYTLVESQLVSLKDALIVASLIEREAYNIDDARIISGVIWNRLFINMPLQLDATLQYARGSLSSEEEWWPVPKPADKYVKSPFNTYANESLPPEPIANPSLEMVLAALNPRTTNCLFYFHETRTLFHCSETYQAHVKKLKEVYGQGR